MTPFFRKAISLFLFSAACSFSPRASAQMYDTTNRLSRVRGDTLMWSLADPFAFQTTSNLISRTDALSNGVAAANAQIEAGVDSLIAETDRARLAEAALAAYTNRAGTALQAGATNAVYAHYGPRVSALEALTNAAATALQPAATNAVYAFYDPLILALAGYTNTAAAALQAGATNAVYAYYNPRISALAAYTNKAGTALQPASTNGWNTLPFLDWVLRSEVVGLVASAVGDQLSADLDQLPGFSNTVYAAVLPKLGEWWHTNAPATPAAYFTYETNGLGEIVITGYAPPRAEKRVEIPARIDGRPVTGVGYAAFSGEGGAIESLALPETLRDIGAQAFPNMTSLNSRLVIPASVTNVGDNAFAYLPAAMGDRMVLFDGDMPDFGTGGGASPFMGGTEVTILRRSGTSGWENFNPFFVAGLATVGPAEAVVLNGTTNLVSGGIVDLGSVTWGMKITDADDVDGTPLTADGQIMVWDNARKVFDFTDNINRYADSQTVFTVNGKGGAVGTNNAVVLSAGDVGAEIAAPAGVPGLSLWLDAADASTITADGDLVEEWRDKSGNGNVASARNGAVRPRLMQSSVNYRPSVKFDGYTNGLDLSSEIIPTNITMLAVFTRHTNLITSVLLGGPFDPRLGQDPGQTGGCMAGWWYNGSTENTGSNRTDELSLDTGDNLWVCAGDHTNSWASAEFLHGGIGTMLWNTSRDGSNIAMRVGGLGLTASTTLGTRKVVGTTPIKGIGRCFCGDQPSGVYHNGFICEILLYTRQLSEPEITALEGYLSAKWASASLLPTDTVFQKLDRYGGTSTNQTLVSPTVTNGVFTGHVTVPEVPVNGTDAASANFVRAQLQAGVQYFSTTNAATGFGFQPTNRLAYSSTTKPAETSYSTFSGTFTNGEYITASVFPSKFTKNTILMGPASAVIYASYTPALAGSSLSIRPEIGYSYDGTNIAERFEALAYQPVVLGATNKLEWTISFPNVTLTNDAWAVLRMRAANVTKVASITFGRGGDAASFAQLRQPDTTTLGARGATNITDGVTQGTYTEATRTFDISAITGKAITNGGYAQLYGATISGGTVGTDTAPLKVCNTNQYGAPYTQYSQVWMHPSGLFSIGALRNDGLFQVGRISCGSIAFGNNGSADSPLVSDAIGQSGIYFVDGGKSLAIGLTNQQAFVVTQNGTSVSNNLTVGGTGAADVLVSRGAVLLGPTIGGKQATLFSNGTNLWFVNVNSVTNALTTN